jgi:hypothetical protein
VTDLGELVMNLCSTMHGGMELEVGDNVLLCMVERSSRWVAECQGLGQWRPWWLEPSPLVSVGSTNRD